MAQIIPGFACDLFRKQNVSHETFLQHKCSIYFHFPSHFLYTPVFHVKHYENAMNRPQIAEPSNTSSQGTLKVLASPFFGFRNPKSKIKWESLPKTSICAG
jgi:hypothetical protein